MMLEAGQGLGWLSALVLLAAFLAWFRPGRGPLVQQIRQGPEPAPGASDTAPRLLLSGVGLSTLAAILSVAGCLFE